MYRHSPKRHSSIAVAALLSVTLAPAVLADLDTARQDYESGDIRSSIVRLKSLLQENPNDADARLMLGKVYLEHGAGLAAEQELLRARAAGANDYETRVGLIRALQGLGELSRALELAEPPAEASAEQRAEILALRGGVLLAQEKERAASSAFAEALETSPDNLRATLGMAALEMSRGEFDLARVTIDQAIVNHGESPDAWQFLALLEERQRQPEAAVDALGKAIAVSSSDWALRYQRATIQLSLGKLNEAAADIKAIRDQAGALPTLAYLEGVLALKRGDSTRAIELLDAYLQIKPDDTRAIYHAALALSGTGRHAQAEEYLLRFSSAMPGNVAGQTLLARTRLALGNPAGAEEAITPIVESKRVTPLALEILRQALTAQGRTEEAAEVVKRAAKRFPKIVSAQLALAGQMLTEGDRDGALALLDRILSDDPENERAMLLVIAAHTEKGDLGAAKSMSDTFLQRLPQSPLAHTLRGGLLIRLQDVDGARAAFSKALSIDPSFERAALGLALLELESDGAQQAQDVLGNLLKADPGNVSGLLADAMLAKRNSGVEAYEAKLKEALRKNRAALPLRLALARSYLSRRDSGAALAVLKTAPPEQANAEPLLLLRAEGEFLSSGPAVASATVAKLAEKVSDNARYRYLLASLAAARGDMSGAESQLEAGLEIDSGSQLTAERLDFIVAAQPSAEERKRLIDRLLRVAQGKPMLRFAQAKLLAEQGDYGKALAVLKGLHQSDRDRTNYLLALASVTEKAKGPQRAKVLLKGWLQKHPNEMSARIMLAELALKTSDSKLAIEQYKQVLETDPSNAFALNNLAMLMLPQNPAAAMAYADRALRQRPGDPSISDTKGAVLLAMGDYKAALPLLAKAHQESREPGVAFRYAKALAASGDVGGARRVLLNIQSRSFPEKAEADALLNRLTPR